MYISPSVHIDELYYRVYLGEEFLIYKIKSNCFPKKFGFILLMSNVWEFLFYVVSNIAMVQFKNFANLVGAKMHHREWR